MPMGPLEDLLGVSWGILGASWVPLGASWDLLGASWGLLGAPMAYQVQQSSEIRAQTASDQRAESL